MKTRAKLSTLLRTLRTLALGVALAAPAIATEARADDPAVEAVARARVARLAALRKAKQDYLTRKAEQAAVAALRDTYATPNGAWIASPAATRPAAKRAS